VAGDRIAVVSVDLDEVPCYAAIHGVAVEGGAHAIYDHAIDRLAALFDDEEVPATFFVIGSDLAREASAAKVRALAAMGHELASHTLSHYYDLTRRDRRTIELEIAGNEDAFARAGLPRPVGFRAPGYTITDEVFEVLVERGYAYDSSVFPSPTYYAGKAAFVRMMRSLGRVTRSIVDDPRVLLAPAEPYRVGRPYWQRGSGIVELPIAVTRGARAHYIGTSVAMAGERGARMLTRAMSGRRVVSLELHGIDASDADADGLGWLAAHQRDLSRSSEKKIAALRAAIRTLREMGYRFATAKDAATAVA
jgi:hypothetical protein